MDLTFFQAVGNMEEGEFFYDSKCRNNRSSDSGNYCPCCGRLVFFRYGVWDNRHRLGSGWYSYDWNLCYRYLPIVHTAEDQHERQITNERVLPFGKPTNDITDIGEKPNIEHPLPFRGTQNEHNYQNHYPHSHNSWLCRVQLLQRRREKGQDSRTFQRLPRATAR